MGFNNYSEGGVTLLDSASSIGPGSPFDWRGGRGVFSLKGTGAAKLQWSPDGGTTWLDADRSGDTYVTITSPGAGLFELPPCKIRANATVATALTAYAQMVTG